MATKDLSAISSRMKKLDICMMTTQSGRGVLTSRPMSNNGDVEYDGNSWFFTFEGSQKVKDITNNPQVNLNFEGPKNLFISVTGSAKLIHNKARLQEHWLDELKQWFKEGVDTPGIVLIHVKASRITYWQNEDEGEIKL
ncbi:MAG: pyridoxamine 5'-phosphate oxidase family protein [Bacteroidota bacterium]